MDVCYPILVSPCCKTACWKSTKKILSPRFKRRCWGIYVETTMHISMYPCLIVFWYVCHKSIYNPCSCFNLQLYIYIYILVYYNISVGCWHLPEMHGIPCGTAICWVFSVRVFRTLRACKILFLPASHGIFVLTEDGAKITFWSVS